MIGESVVYRVPGHSGLRAGTIEGITETWFLIRDTDGSLWKIPFEFAMPTTKEGLMKMFETPLARDIRVATSTAFVNAHFWVFVKAHYDDIEVWNLGKQATFLQDADEAPTA